VPSVSDAVTLDGELFQTVYMRKALGQQDGCITTCVKSTVADNVLCTG